MASSSAPGAPPAARDRLGVALTPAAALAVHELRYRLAFGSGADARLHAEGHAYLAFALPLAGVVAAILAGLWLVRIARGGSRAGESRRRRPLVVWVAASVALLALYAGQELTEGALSAGHPTGLVGVFGHGGLWAVPSALAVAGVLAFLLRGADAVSAVLAEARPRVAALLRSPLHRVAPTRPRAVTTHATARRPRGRAPPLAHP